MLDKIKKLFSKDEIEKRFDIPKKMVSDIIKQYKDNKKYEIFDDEALKILEFYGIKCAKYEIVRSKNDIFSSIIRIKLPAILKVKTSKIIHRNDIGAVFKLNSKEDVHEGYAQVLGEVASNMPWIETEALIVQEFIEGRDLNIIAHRRQKNKYPLIINDTELNSIEDVTGKLNFEHEDIFNAVVFLLQFPEVKKAEIDFRVSRYPVAVDAKIWLYE